MAQTETGGPAAAEDRLAMYLGLEAPPQSIGSLLHAIIVGESWDIARGVDAFELAEQWARRFSERLRRTLSGRNLRGQFCHFAFNSADQDFLQGACFVEPSDTVQVATEKRRRSGHGDYLAALTSLDPIEFEWACRGVLALMGVLDPTVTVRAADEGIDFFGRLNLDSELRRAGVLPGVYRQFTVWLVGQAKHYRRTQVATPDIRELVGSVILARARAFARPGSHQGLNIRACDPVFFLFFTTGSISRESWSLIESSGVIGMDGLMLAAFLADHEMGWSDVGLDEEGFRAWVHQYRGGPEPTGAGFDV